jgi:hypothetical protein
MIWEFNERLAKYTGELKNILWMNQNKNGLQHFASKNYQTDIETPKLWISNYII